MNRKTFNHIFLIGRPHVPGVPDTLDTLKTFLESLNVQVTVETSSDACMDSHNKNTCETNAIPSTVDLIIVVGGDGSLLNAAHVAIKHNLPIIGIHRGRLGFLTDIHPDHLESIKHVIDGEYKSEDRSWLQATVKGQKQIALNDIVFMPSNAPQMIEFEIYIDEQFVCKQRADGLVVATSTGSTAYALSGGGPIVSPQLNATILVAICPHTLSSRPLVISSESSIDILITDMNKDSVNISPDGMSHTLLNAGDHVFIEAYDKKLRLIHPINYNYYTTLREKLGWEKHAQRT